MAAILIVFMTFKGSGFGWMGDWRQWLIVGVVSLIAALIPRGMRVSAGADWVAHRRNEFAKTYELASIKFEKDWGEGLLDIDDIHGSGVRVGLGVLRTNQDLWDLVYNGIRHSVANGAEVNDLAIQRLRLYDVVAMRDAARGYRAPGGPHPF